MMLWRALHAETLKMKRTIALWMIAISPAVVVILLFFAAYQTPFSTLNRNGAGSKWLPLAHLALRVWAALMMPLFIALETALVAGLDHSGNQWKILLARPVPRWTLYIAKLIVVTAMTAAGTLTLLCGILLDGTILPLVQPELHFGAPVPWATIFREGACVLGLSFPALAIQHWVSLRWRSFPVAIGTGIVALVGGLFAVAMSQQTGGWPEYFPWALPMLPFAKEPPHIPTVLWIGGAITAVIAIGSCIDLCRRETT